MNRQFDRRMIRQVQTLLACVDVALEDDRYSGMSDEERVALRASRDHVRAAVRSLERIAPFAPPKPIADGLLEWGGRR